MRKSIEKLQNFHEDMSYYTAENVYHIAHFVIFYERIGEHMAHFAIFRENISQRTLVFNGFATKIKYFRGLL